MRRPVLPASLAAKAAMAAALALIPACGKRGEPLPPLRKTPLGVSGLRIAQGGDRLEVSCTAPRASVDGVPLTVLSVEILRADREGELDKVGQRKVFGVAPGAVLTELVPLPDPGTTVRVAARVLTKGGASTRTPPVSFTVQPPPAAPTNLRATLGAQGVSLAWEGERPQPVPRPTPSPTAEKLVRASPSPGASPAAPASPSPTPGPPPFQGGFWVYRRPAAQASHGRPLSAAPTEARAFDDKTAATGAEVCYVVRAVASVEPLVESAGSNQECVTVRDVTPPATPTGLGVLARDGALEVSWSPSGDRDLVRYRLYRANPGGGFERLTEVAPGETTCLDKDARPGLDYRYRLTAVDGAGNESPPSLPAAGRLP
jgi:hypothetical protein